MRPAASVVRSLKPVAPGMASSDSSVLLVPSFSDTQAMSRPPTTRPPETCSAMPPMPRRLGTTGWILPARSRQKTPPLMTSLK